MDGAELAARHDEVLWPSGGVLDGIGRGDFMGAPYDEKDPGRLRPSRARSRRYFRERISALIARAAELPVSIAVSTCVVPR
jgi:hypothetical protein